MPAMPNASGGQQNVLAQLQMVMGQTQPSSSAEQDGWARGAQAGVPAWGGADGGTTGSQQSQAQAGGSAVPPAAHPSASTAASSQPASAAMEAPQPQHGGQAPESHHQPPQRPVDAAAAQQQPQQQPLQPPQPPPPQPQQLLQQPPPPQQHQQHQQQQQRTGKGQGRGKDGKAPATSRPPVDGTGMQIFANPNGMPLQVAAQQQQAAYYNMPNSPAGGPMYYPGSPAYMPAAYGPGPQMAQYPAPSAMTPTSMYPGGHQYQPQHPGAPRMPGYPPAAKLYGGQKGYGDFHMPAGSYPFGAAPYAPQGGPGSGMHQPPMAGMQPPFPAGGYDAAAFNGARGSYAGGYEGIGGADYHSAQQHMYMQGPSGIFPPNNGL